MIGFDYGTSNCAVGVMENSQPKILSLAGHGRFVPSTLYAPSRDIISHWLHGRLPAEQQQQFKLERSFALQKGQAVLRELNLDGIPTELSFGQHALENYLEEPEEGYYIKSPKSFLGASGLQPAQINLFEDIVAAMMSNIKNLAEDKLQRSIDKTVIGRPVNFQGLKGEESNRQAIEVLTNAAKRIGFKDVEFQFEPVAAGFAFEASLTQEKRVLVVDIGGGTTDCSMILMGPKLAEKQCRTSDLLSHSGVRVGGNDFDIQLALKGIMPNLGMNGSLKSGKPVPINSYAQAVAINNISAQTDFYSPSNRLFLKELIMDAQDHESVARLLKVHDNKLSYQLVNSAEQAKIALSESSIHRVSLDELTEGLNVELSDNTMLNAVTRELKQIADLMSEAITLANCQPDVVFVTGGTAKSPILANFIKNQLPKTELIIGDHFGSVTAGLTRWAERIFR